MSFALVTTLLLLPRLCAILVCTLITTWTRTLKYPTSSVQVHIICATSTTSAGIFPQQQRNVSSTPWLRLELTIATIFSITLPPTIDSISRLQRMHNAAARLILCRPRTDRATPLLRKLNWLPVARRIQYKILLLSYKITHRHAPFYLCDLLPSYQPTRCLRSSSSNALVVPKTRGKAGDAAFAVAAPILWNAFPHQLKCVANINIKKNNLKRRIFLHVSLTLTVLRSDASF